jgi:pyridoxine/pyridoxamine 5'-phosphate oxidase
VNDVIATNRYMVLATADADGVPWVTPVWFATEDERVFYWISDPNARHSRNIAARPEIAIVIFDVFARESEAQGLWVTKAEDVIAPAKHRLYRAVAGEQTMLGPGDARIPLA